MMIAELTKQATRVAAEHEGLQMAKRDKYEAQVEFLRAAVDAVRPALPALCSKVQNIPGPTLRALSVARRLYLGESGQWIEIRDGGAMILARTDHDVVNDFLMEDIVDVLSVALTKHAGSREWTTAEIRKEAERLRAAVLLLKGST